MIKSIFIRIWNRKQIKGGRLVLRNEDYLKIAKSAFIQIKQTLQLGANSIGRNGRSCILRMDSNSTLVVDGVFKFMYGADIVLFENARLELGDGSFINSDAKIRCHNRIHIGNGTFISHDVTIMDSDGHSIDGEKEHKEIYIGNHVWIGTRVTILKGVHIGDGAVIAAGAVLTKNVPSRALAAGVPAKVVRTGISWEA